jgi:Ulp1 family protease
LVQSDTTEEDEYIEEEALRELRQHSKSCKRQERGTFKYEKEKKIDREDEKIYLVYPIQEDAVDAVSIYNGCLKKLNEPEYLNDNLIDWKIKFDINKKAIEDDSILYKIHAFNTLFFTKLTEVKDHQRGFELVKKWTQHVDIFEKDFVFVPVNKDLHWSLIVFTRLNLLKPHGKEDEKEKVTDIDGPEFLQDTDDDNKPVSCILHMDSLSPYGHNGEAFAKTLRLYLQHEWEAKKGSKLAFTSDNLPFHKCSGPTQDNSYDCGVFVIKYVEYILDHINHINPTKKSLKNKRFSKDDNVINDTAFSQECVTIERTKMRSCLEIIHKDWILEMEKIRRQKLEKGEVEDDSYLEIQTQPTIQEKVDTEKGIVNFSYPLFL